MWTQFWDMSSGGGNKEDFKMCYIEAPEAEAKVIFYNRFGHDPERVTCTCCGEDYSISSEKSIKYLTGYHRGCKNVQRNGEWVYLEEGDSSRRWNNYQTLQAYKKSDDVLFIYKKDIKDEERLGEVPRQGYVWQD